MIKKSRPKKTKKDNRSKKTSFKVLAKKRIDELFDQAPKLFVESPNYANNCMRLARKISLRYKVSFSREQKILFCKKCERYLFPSKTARVRVSQGKIVVVCNNCKTISRYLYK